MLELRVNQVRLFQNSALYPSYRRRLNRLLGNTTNFATQRDVFLNDRFGALHFLQPVLLGAPEAFFTNGDDERLQRAWAAENGLNRKDALDEILLAQIEAHRTDIFYNLDPMRYGNAFLSRLPGCVKYSVTWRAAPSVGGQFNNYDLILNNFPSLLQEYRNTGMRAEYFTPAFDPIMDDYAANDDRPIDILFVGGYSRHHQNRAAILESVAELSDQFKVVFHLDKSRMTRLAETPIGMVGPLRKHRRPSAVNALSADPVFGLGLYEAISRSRIVINAAVDMAGQDRGNMRCWEAMGCGALLASDAGKYPFGMQDGDTLLTYDTPSHAKQICETALKNPQGIREIASRSATLVKHSYSKARQWAEFVRLIEHGGSAQNSAFEPT
jgi:hypothetical protein